MSTNAAFAQKPASQQPQQPLAQHVRNNKPEIAVHVLTYPSSQLHYPRHARATFLAKPEVPTPPTRGLGGVAFNLSKGERLFAACAGVLFAAVALAVILI